MVSILTDQRLIEDENDERWKAIADSGEENGERPYSVLRDGITLTVLGPELYYSHNYKSFFSRIDISESMPELLPHEKRGEFLPFPPKFYVKLVLGKTSKRSKIRAIQVGIVTEESPQESIHPDDDRCNIVLATLPYAVFNRYYNGGKGHFSLDMELKVSDVDQLLKKYGWKERERDSDDRWLNWPYELNHKYNDIAYDGI